MVSRATPVEVVDLCDEPSPMLAVARLPVAAASANQENVVDLLDDFVGNVPRMMRRKRNRAESARQGRFKSDPNSPSQEVEIIGETPSRFKTDPNGSPNRGGSFPGQEVDLFNDTYVDEIKVTQTVKPRPENLVLEVFPDADLQHVVQILGQYSGDVPHALAHLAENTYPKSKEPTSSLRTRTNTQTTAVVRLDRKKYQHDYMSSESFHPTALYMAQSWNQLLHDFPFLSKTGSQKIMIKFKNHYAIAHDKILNAVKGTQAEAGKDLEDVQYQRVLFAFSGSRLQDDQTKRMDELMPHLKATLKKPRRSNPAPLITDMTLLDEISYVKQKLNEWMDIARQRTKRKRNREMSQRNGTGVECSCCFDEVAIDDMVAW
jgi:hypothetical protein